MAKGRQIAYALSADISCFADCSNARQKIRLVGETMSGCVLVPSGRRSLLPAEAHPARIVELSGPIGLWRVAAFLNANKDDLLAYGMAVSNEISFLFAIVLSFLTKIPVVLFCWDPPGVSVRNRTDVFSRMRIKVMDALMSCAVRFSCGLILNLHPGFLKGRFPESVREKIFSFPNGTTLDKNRGYADRAMRVPKRFAVACRVSEQKGCWDIVNFFLKLFKRDNAVSLVWVGGGKDKEVQNRLHDGGVPESQIVMPGDLPRDEALKYIATASFAINMYPDVPSLRWNYVLKGPEFLSFGLPIVTNELPGMSEYAVDGETGIVFETGDLDTAVEKTLAVLNDEKLYDRMSVAARTRALRYDWERINTQIADKIEELLVERDK